ncbi:MAG: carboxypeptidase-like regulatory domain-containing protein, partial [Chitinophagaceae bacterium]
MIKLYTPVFFIIFLCLLTLQQGALAQKGSSGKPVKGKVVDDTGSPLIGVTVTVKGSPGGTLTDNDGSFSLNIAGPSAYIVFSSVGFAAKEMMVKEGSFIN